jgi:glycine/D-amino acid oxidase-like deaminating enzyme
MTEPEVWFLICRYATRRKSMSRPGSTCRGTTTMSEATPADLACLTAQGDRVYVMPSGDDDRFVTIGVRDDDVDDENFTRAHCRDLVDLEPPDAIRLARYLLDWATDVLDQEAGDE